MAQVRARAFAGLLTAVTLAACGGGTSTPPSSTPPPQSPPPGSGAIQITGRERIGWSQTADDITSYHFAMYVDDARTDLPSATCRANPAGGYDCDSPLPSLTPGAHKLEMVSWITNADGVLLESPRAAPLMVFVTGLVTSSMPGTSSATARSSPAPSSGESPQASGTSVTTGCGLTSLPDQQVVMWDETGEIRAMDSGLSTSRALAWKTAEDQEWVLSGIASHPRFTETRWFYLAELAGTSEPRLRLSRVRELGDILGERAVLLETSLAFQPSRTAVKFGSDGRLYVALLGSPATANGDSSVRSGRFLIRLDENGVPPADNESGSIFARISSINPLAIAWMPGDSRPWVIEPDGKGRYVLRQPGSDPQQSFIAPAPAVALQFAQTELGEPEAFVTGARGNGQRLDRTTSGWALQTPLQLFSDGRPVRDALLLPNGGLVTCGPVTGDQQRYGASVSRLPF